jgi:hypothetical protein
MDKSSANPIIVILFFFLRCLVPIGIMLGISYLLRRLGLITEHPHEPEDHLHNNAGNSQEKGNVAHGSL